MNEVILYIILIIGLPLLGFIYYLEHKKRMYLLERYGLKDEPEGAIREKKLIKGLFLSLSGLSLTFIPNIANIADISDVEATLTLEMLLIGAIVTCAGLAMVIGCGILKSSNPSCASQISFEVDKK